MVLTGKVRRGVESGVFQLLELIGHETLFLRDQNPPHWKAPVCVPRTGTEALLKMAYLALWARRSLGLCFLAKDMAKVAFSLLHFIF